MSIKILIMGLPGSGKTELAKQLKLELESFATVDWFNADYVRAQFNDWDFSEQGRFNQSLRMSNLACLSNKDFVICDFVAPLVIMRKVFAADFTIWMDTIEAGRFEDTNRMFVPPKKYDFKITNLNAVHWATVIKNQLVYGTL